MYWTKAYTTLYTPLYEYCFEYPMIKWSIPLVLVPASYYNWYMMRKIAYPRKYSLMYMCAQLKVYKKSTASYQHNSNATRMPIFRV